MLELYKFIKNAAREEHFALCGVTRPCVVPGYDEAVEGWIGSGRHAGMEWMRRNSEVRRNPARLVEGAATIAVCAASYHHRRIPQPGEARIAAYALAPDYHTTLKEALHRMLDRIEAQTGHPLHGRVFVDSAPLTERYWAAQAGLGWIGRSGMLINKDYGSFLLLGEIVLSEASDRYDEPDTFNGCGSCSACTDACPTGAIGADRRIDCNRCLSYLTIEHRGAFPPEAERLLAECGEGRIYGCDACMETCPWNHSERIGLDAWNDREGRAQAIRLAGKSAGEWLQMDEAAFAETYGGTPLFRTGLEAIQRNVRIICKK